MCSLLAVGIFIFLEKEVRTMKISEIQPALRPYERLEQYGSEALSDEELLAIILRTGTKGRSSKEIALELLSGLSPQVCTAWRG